MKIYGIAITLAATLFVSCSRDEGATPGGGRRELAVNVQMTSSDWTTRLGGGSAADGTYDRTQVLGSAALDEQLEVVAECEPIGYTPDAQNTPDAPLTRGTPIVSATGLQTLGFAVYTNSVFTKNCTATNNGGSWNIAGNVEVDLDNNKYNYYAYAPVAVAADNGIELNEADGKTLTYTAPDDITKQPDLCRANPITEDKTGTPTFAMQHALTAIGIKVRADNVEIKSIKLLSVNTSGKLNLITGVWEGLGAVKDLAFTLTNNKPETGDGVANITPSDGYLMLPPQTLTGDGKKLEIVYHYTSGSDTAEHTGIHLLSDITGNAWAAGQKVHYIIQLKAKFALELTPASATVPRTAGSYSLNYTTGSSASTTIDPTVSCSNLGDWIFNLKVNHGNGSGTITFNYTQNTSQTMPRNTEIKVTSGFTTKTFVLTQEGPPVVLIAGTKWAKANLTGDASTNSGHRLEANPQDKGMFFKWGATYVYKRASDANEGEGFVWEEYTRGAATNPINSPTSGRGYDYSDISGGSSYVGDPCQKLGANYKTPTVTQWDALYNSGHSGWTTYQGMAGFFCGPSASSCTNSTIQPGCIFLPACGSRSPSDGKLSDEGLMGNYWSSSVYNVYYSHKFYIRNIGIYVDKGRRGCGYSVRCIQE